MNHSLAYQELCTEFYELDKPYAPPDALLYYLDKAREAHGPILEPMCGTGRFYYPLLEKGFAITGFDRSTSMLQICREKCVQEGLKSDLHEADFVSFHSKNKYKLIFIPNSSFCLLTDPREIHQALQKMHGLLDEEGQFIFEVETIHATAEQDGQWRARWIERPDGTLLVGNFVSRFNPLTHIETVLCRYELWQKNSIVKTDVEELRIRLYETDGIDALLEEEGFVITRKSVPYTSAKGENKALLYECAKQK